MSNKQNRQTDNVYEIIERPGGSFDIFPNGSLIGGAIPNRWLEDQLAQHGSAAGNTATHGSEPAMIQL